MENEENPKKVYFSVKWFFFIMISLLIISVISCTVAFATVFQDDITELLNPGHRNRTFEQCFVNHAKCDEERKDLQKQLESCHEKKCSQVRNQLISTVYGLSKSHCKLIQQYKMKMFKKEIKCCVNFFESYCNDIDLDRKCDIKGWPEFHQQCFIPDTFNN